MSGMAIMIISKAYQEGICEKKYSRCPLSKVLLSPSLRQQLPLLVHCSTGDFLCYSCASGEIIWQLVRTNGYFRTFPPTAKAAHNIFCKIMDLQNFIAVDCSPLSAVHRASYCLTIIPILSQGNQLLISFFVLISVSQAMKDKA